MPQCADRKAEKYIRVLTPDEIEEIDAASKVRAPSQGSKPTDKLQSFEALSLPLSRIDRTTFPLPKLGGSLRDISKNIYDGTGLGLLRGFPIQNYGKRDQIVIFLGLSAWIGDQRLAQGIGRGLCHIKVCVSPTLSPLGTYSGRR
jgi:hypothetical protein